MGIKQTVTEYSIDEVRGLADILRRYSERYLELAKKLDEHKIPAIRVPNQKSLQDGLDKLRRHIAEAEVAFNECLDMKSVAFTKVSSEQPVAAEKREEFYITPVGKNKSPAKAKPAATESTKKKAE
jgi:hypothetical protein